MERHDIVVRKGDKTELRGTILGRSTTDGEIFVKWENETTSWHKSKELKIVEKHLDK